MKAPRFNFDKDHKLWMACDTKNGFHLGLEFIHFKGGYAYASDAHILVRVPLNAFCGFADEDDKEKLDGFSVHWKVYKKIISYDTAFVYREDPTCIIKVELEGHRIEFSLVPSALIAGVPDFESVLKSRDNEQTKMVGISPSELSRLSAALNLNAAGLNLCGERGSIIVRNVDDFGIGLIMPKMMREE